MYGDTITLSLSTEGPDTKYYQWKKDGILIDEGVNSSVLHINAFSSEHEGKYVCIVSNIFSSFQYQTELAEIKGIFEYLL